jgi:hypothetical protein
LKAPAALEARYESYVAARRRGFALMLEAQSRSAPSTTREAHGEESTELSEKRAQLARELGFRTCR